jgi:peptidyl-prolyl cis-trans isomerase B (cyclophilin B)
MEAAAMGHILFRIWTTILISSAAFLLVVGCSRQKEAGNEIASPQKIVVAAPTSNRAAADSSFVPFLQAVRLDPPEGEQRPPDITASGKPIGKLFEKIEGKDGSSGLWDQVKFIAPDGNPIRHIALVKTDAGDLKIELLQDAAPNHVRSFICLARAGYFDGLPFHQSIRREGKDFQGYLESGCPRGSGELGYGSIGYWLKPEIKEDLKHEEGTVGAWHPPDELERVACRFYITLNKNPGLDGRYTIFGKVVQGIDVAHTINKRPIQDDEYKGPAQEPYRIRQVIIEQQ